MSVGRGALEPPAVACDSEKLMGSLTLGFGKHLPSYQAPRLLAWDWNHKWWMDSCRREHSNLEWSVRPSLHYPHDWISCSFPLHPDKGWSSLGNT